MCLRFEDHCRAYHSFAIWSDEFTEVHGKWTDNVLVFYGYDVNCKRSIDASYKFPPVMSLPAMSLGLMSVPAERVGQGEVGGFQY